jgi:regulator of replication initiation timing
MDWIALIGILLAPITAFAGWLAGRRKRSNDFLHAMQESINKLVAENSKLLDDVLTVKRQNVELLIQNEVMRKKLATLEEQNAQFKEEITELNSKLQNVKTITRTK